MSIMRFFAEAKPDALSIEEHFLVYTGPDAEELEEALVREGFQIFKDRLPAGAQFVIVPHTKEALSLAWPSLTRRSDACDHCGKQPSLGPTAYTPIDTGQFFFLCADCRRTLLTAGEIRCGDYTLVQEGQIPSLKSSKQP